MNQHNNFFETLPRIPQNGIDLFDLLHIVFSIWVSKYKPYSINLHKILINQLLTRSNMSCTTTLHDYFPHNCDTIYRCHYRK